MQSKIQDYGMSKIHNPISKEVYDFISELDYKNGDMFCFKSGGDGDNGEMLMDLLDKFLESKANVAANLLKNDMGITGVIKCSTEEDLQKLVDTFGEDNFCSPWYGQEDWIRKTIRNGYKYVLIENGRPDCIQIVNTISRQF